MDNLHQQLRDADIEKVSLIGKEFAEFCGNQSVGAFIAFLNAGFLTYMEFALLQTIVINAAQAGNIPVENAMLMLGAWLALRQSGVEQ